VKKGSKKRGLRGGKGIRENGLALGPVKPRGGGKENKDVLESRDARGRRTNSSRGKDLHVS